jgi:hypothetical protein
VGFCIFETGIVGLEMQLFGNKSWITSQLLLEKRVSGDTLSFWCELQIVVGKWLDWQHIWIKNV